MSNIDEFRDPTSGMCKCFKPKNGQMMIVNVEDPVEYEYYRNKPCFKGNLYAEYCEFCAKDLCLYYKIEVNLVPQDQGKTIILDTEETKRYKEQKS